jgi:hypothetical protein
LYTVSEDGVPSTVVTTVAMLVTGGDGGLPELPPPQAAIPAAKMVGKHTRFTAEKFNSTPV